MVMGAEGIEIWVWYIPLTMADRLEEHTGDVTKAFVKRIPSCASWSILGVFISVSP